jgi:hypothetical protein
MSCPKVACGAIRLYAGGPHYYTIAKTHLGTA